jgi:acyl-CoA thioester hydrolase
LDPLGVEIWRGGIAPWQCDEMGHWNSRFYVATAMEALAPMAAALGMSRAFTPGASATLVVREHHIRFLKEARVGSSLHMTGGVLSFGEADALLLQTLVHSGTGEPAAAIRTRVEHVTPRDLRPFPWAPSARRLAEGLKVTSPDFALARGIPDAPVVSQAGLKAALALGMPVTATGAFTPADCDVFARMAPEQMLARAYAGAGHFLQSSQDAVIAAQPELDGRLGGAMVEFRALYHAWPGPGDQMQLRSGLKAATNKMRRVVHWMLDPASGAPWASCEGLLLFLDLKARRSLTVADAAQEAIAGELIPTLSL